MRSIRVMVVLGVVGALMFAAAGGGEVVTQAVAVVQTVRTQMTMTRIRDAIVQDHAMSGIDPPDSLDSPDEVEALVRDVLETPDDSDAALDPWLQPYLLVPMWGDLDDEWLLMSTGPNGELDGACDPERWEWPDYLDAQDDICVRFRLIAAGQVLGR